MSSGNKNWKAILFDQLATMMRLVQDGRRDKIEVSRILQAIIDGAVVSINGLFPSQRLAADLIPEGCTVESDVAPSGFEISDLEFIHFLNEGEPPIKGDVMRARARNLMSNFGLVDGKKMLADQGKIPTEVRDRWIVLTGTVLCDSVGFRHVAYIFCEGGRWYLNFGRLVHGWDSGNRLARCKLR